MLIRLGRSTVRQLERFIRAALVRVVAASDLVRGREIPLILADVVTGSVHPKQFPTALHDHLLKLETV